MSEQKQREELNALLEKSHPDPDIAAEQRFAIFQEETRVEVSMRAIVDSKTGERLILVERLEKDEPHERPRLISRYAIPYRLLSAYQSALKHSSQAFECLDEMLEDDHDIVVRDHRAGTGDG